MPRIEFNQVTAVILAGGTSRRMRGRDKISMQFDQQSLLERALHRLRPQVSSVILSANSDRLPPGQFNELPIINDSYAGKAGPLDGVVSAMTWLENNSPDRCWLLSVPVDCPFLPLNLCKSLAHALKEHPQAKIAIASSANKPHYVCALWSLDIALAGRNFLSAGGRAMKHFIKQQKHVLVEFAFEKIDPFININTPEDYENALHALANV